MKTFCILVLVYILWEMWSILQYVTRQCAINHSNSVITVTRTSQYLISS